MKKGTLVIYTGKDMVFRQMTAEVEEAYHNPELDASFIITVPDRALHAAFNSSLIPLEEVIDGKR